MAVTVLHRSLAGSVDAPASAVQTPLNDAMSFWKLPETWSKRLAAHNEESIATVEHYLFERYLAEQNRQPPPRMETYYRIKHLIPDSLRYRLNSLAVRSRRPLSFPHWPCEDALLEHWRKWLREALAAMQVEDAWHIGLWPHGHACCVVLTHDVESPRGLEQMEAMADLEERYGFRSAWNLPLAQYRIDWKRIEELIRRGFEFGAHGLRHDGRLFRSLADFQELKPTLETLAREHDLRGFRAPSTLRRGEWLATLDFDFDSSFADTDPYEPQPGGTCSVFPFFLYNLIELPYTLPQDHTLIHLLHRSPLPVWVTKSDWIASVSGMILLLTHPDYCGSEPYLNAYEALLKHLSTLQSAWRALPSEVADWWRRRTAMTLTVEGDKPMICGPDTTGAIARRLSAEPLAR